MWIDQPALGYVTCVYRLRNFNSYPAKIIYLNFHPLEVVSRYCDPQLQVAENYSYLLKFEHKYLQNLDV